MKWNVEVDGVVEKKAKAGVTAPEAATRKIVSIEAEKFIVSNGDLTLIAAEGPPVACFRAWYSIVRAE